MNNLSSFGTFPHTRLRRNRSHPWLRHLTSEHQLTTSDLIYPVFVMEGENMQTAIASMPNIFRFTIDKLVEHVALAKERGIPAIALFPVVPSEKKDPHARQSYDAQNLICRSIAAIAEQVADIGIIADVALDPYTPHGHDGILSETGEVDNDATLDILCKQAITQAQAGCHIIAPSDMMDGRVTAIRKALDTAGYAHIGIMSYAAKYASAFYTPFRHALGSQSHLGKADKRSYQMDPANSDEALREIALDIAEGADSIIIKPGMPYLDIIQRAQQTFSVPICAYQVSGEYAMIKGLTDDPDEQHALFMESLIAFKRAGASAILTYAALDIAAQLTQ